MSAPYFPSSDSDLRAHLERAVSDSYELEQEIGRGGMGIVYRARDRRLKRPVAIKLLPPELAFRSEIRSRFLREAETAAQLSHPNIVPIFSVDERDGLVFFVMAYVAGENLAARLHRDGAFSSQETRRILIDVSRALAYAHERGVVHRDIKPDNILIDADGRVMVTDFGIARAVSEGAEARLTATGIAIGTPAYMSPEQSTGEREVDGRSDLYSLGIVGYQMLTGELPFNATSTPALLVKHLSEVPPPVQERCPNVEPDLGRAMMILLEKDPANRFESAVALARALETRDVPVTERSIVPAPLLSQPLPRALPADPEGLQRGEVSDDELARWRAPEVDAFRKKVAPWAFFGVASIILSIFGVIDLAGVWGLWTIWMAWKYAKLWTEGYSWRDVLKEPEDRMFFDVVGDWVDNVRALWDPKKRQIVRDRERLRSRISPPMFEPRVAAPLPHAARNRALPAAGAGGRHATALRQAARNREDILRMVETLPKRDQHLLADVPSSAVSIYERIESIAYGLEELERKLPEGTLTEVDAEITRLEAEANPLDTVASEARVKRLAQLKRQRRAFADVDGRGAEKRAQLESLALALENMRMEVVRLKTLPHTSESITSVAQRAVSLAREVDIARQAREEVAKLTQGPSGSGRR